MPSLREQHLSGFDYLEAATGLLQRVRMAHATAGLYEAADLQWWWRKARSTDGVPQLFWFDHLGRPAAAVIAIHWGDRTALAPIVMPDAPRGWSATVLESGLAHAKTFGVTEVEVGLAHHVLTTGIDLLAEAGAEPIKICFEPGHPASSHLYLDVGIEPDRQTVVSSNA